MSDFQILSDGQLVDGDRVSNVRRVEAHCKALGVVALIVQPG